MMLKTLCLVVVASTVAAAFVASEGYINYEQCTDLIFCRPETCKTQQIPENYCMGAGQGVMQKLSCSPVEQACGVLGRYSDRFCTVALSTQAFVCNECAFGKNQNIACQRKNGIESLQVSECQKSQCQDCTPTIDVPKGQCIESKDDKDGSLVFIKYEGAALCTSVNQQVWKGTTCSGMPMGKQTLAVGYCINGTKLACKYDNITKH